ncbi:MAG: hypothetical protein IT370_34430 [Deltaproteobacteria bacterium]|nr:hypothetical protein [Deltaproteobacteria bacterium]
MRKLVLASVVLLSLGVVGCKKKKDKPTPTADPSTSASPSMTPSPLPTASPVDTTHAMNKMKNCPNAAAGATTTVEDVEGGVKLVIVGADPAAVTEIKARTKTVIAAFKPENTEVKHTGEGTGLGAGGKCPLVLVDATAEVKESDKGVEVTLKVADAAKLDEVRKRVKERNDAMGGKGGGDGTGGGQGTGGGGGGGGN